MRNLLLWLKITWCHGVIKERSVWLVKCDKVYQTKNNWYFYFAEGGYIETFWQGIVKDVERKHGKELTFTYKNVSPDIVNDRNLLCDTLAKIERQSWL
jgi:hypothetical protein